MHFALNQARAPDCHKVQEPMADQKTTSRLFRVCVEIVRCGSILWALSRSFDTLRRLGRE